MGELDIALPRPAAIMPVQQVWVWACLGCLGSGQRARVSPSVPPIASLIMLEISTGPDSSNSMPLISEMARQPLAIVVI